MTRRTPASPVRREASAPARSDRRGLPWFRIVSATVFVALALLTLESVRLGAAGLYAQRAQLDMDRRNTASGQSAAANAGGVEGQLADAFRLAPDSPWILEQVGALDLAKMRASASPRQAIALTRDARLRFRQALRQRPTSPFLWANLAQSKLYLDEIDAEFLAALRHAEELGPWEPVVQQVIVFAGLAAWSQLDDDLRQALVRTLERGSLRNAEKMAQIVKSYRRFDLICGISKYNAFVGADCQERRRGTAPIVPR